MQYYSTNKNTAPATLEKAVVRGLAPDKGLYMPWEIKPLPQEFYDHIAGMTLPDIACRVADALFGGDVPQDVLHGIVRNALNFPVPLTEVEPGIWSLELFHGPTLAFKDVGARFMARLLGYFIRKEGRQQVNVLVATSGDTGSAVANGFLGVEGIRVYVLYPKGKVSETQEKQFTTLGRNITAVEVDGTFDDCQALVKAAFTDSELQARMDLTSANSINVARFLPQSFYYFHAYAQLRQAGHRGAVVACVPSGNFGNLAAGLAAKRMGLPIARFIAANNRNDVFLQYLRTGRYEPRPSVTTIANAMDVGAPSNFARIMDLYLPPPPHGLPARPPRGLRIPSLAQRPPPRRSGLLPGDRPPGQVPPHGGGSRRLQGGSAGAPPRLHAGAERVRRHGQQLRRVQSPPPKPRIGRTAPRPPCTAN